MYHMHCTAQMQFDDQVQVAHKVLKGLLKSLTINCANAQDSQLCRVFIVYVTRFSICLSSCYKLYCAF